MKTLIIICSLVTLFLHEANSKTSVKFNIPNFYSRNTADTINVKKGKTLLFGAKTMVTCEKNCIIHADTFIKKYAGSKFYVVYKISDSKWFVNKKPNENTINSLSKRKMTILNDNIYIMDKKYTDVKHIIIIE